MREKYESLSVSALRDIAKARGIKGVTSIKKADLVEMMLAEDEKDKAKQEEKSRENNSKESSTKENIIKEEKAREEKPREDKGKDEKFPSELDSGMQANGILEVMPDGFGFIRCENFLPGENDVYVSPSQIRRFNLKTGDIIEGNIRVKTQNEKFSALLFVKKINGFAPEIAGRRGNFEDMTPVFPDERIKLETPGASVAMRVMDLISPVGKEQNPYLKMHLRCT